MTTESNKCSFSSLFPMSCRNKAEAFARRLHSRLTSLGSEDGRPVADETTWLAGHENSVAISQPRHSDPDLYFDFTLLESPGSPEEEIPQTELARFITNENDNLNLVHGDDCHCSKQSNAVLPVSANGQTISSDSDSSDGQYFDPDTDEKVVSNVVDGLVLSNRKTFGNSVNSLSCSEEDSTLSLQDYPSLEYSSCIQDLPIQCDDKESTPESNDSNETFSARYDLEELGNTLDTLKLNGDACDLDCDSPKDNISKGKIDENGLSNSKQGDVSLENEQTDEPESYCSTLRIEHNLTVDINGKDQVNEVQLNIEDDNEDREEPIPRVRRCSSLKTGKTPPGTPGRKKIVRFADVLGLDLADVRTFLDEIPKIPNSAYADLNADRIKEDSYAPSYKPVCNPVEKILVPLFQQPGGEGDFIDRVRDNFVCLENAIVEDPITLSIKGTVRVRNLDFNKSVHIRYSLDSWKTFSDLQASYADNSCDGFSDTFTFLMYVNTITVGQRVEFAPRFQCKGTQYWDNNRGSNYSFQCLPGTNTTPYTPITGNDDSWGAAFYYAERTPREFARHRQAAVHEYIAATLDRHKKKKTEYHNQSNKWNNSDTFTVIVILIFSIVFLYIQRAIYFT